MSILSLFFVNNILSFDLEKKKGITFYLWYENNQLIEF